MYLDRGQYTWGGGTQLFSGRNVQPRFPNIGACERINCHKSEWIFIKNRGFRTDILQNFQAFWQKLQSNLSFLSWKSSYFLKNVCFGGEIFLSNGDLVNELVPQLGVLWTAGEAWKGGSWGPHIPVPPFQVSAPPGEYTGTLTLLPPVQIVNLASW